MNDIPSSVTHDSATAKHSSDRAATEARRCSLADPGPWAVTAFATTSFVLGMFNAGLLDKTGAVIVLPIAFFYGGLIQIIVGVLEIIRGNLFGAVVFGTYGPFWVIYGAVETWFGPKIPPGSTPSAVALFLAVFAVVTFYFILAALRTDIVLVAIFILIFAGLVLLATGSATGASGITVAGGWVTLAFAVLAWYHAAADMINTSFGRDVAPLGRIG